MKRTLCLFLLGIGIFSPVLHAQDWDGKLQRLEQKVSGQENMRVKAINLSYFNHLLQLWQDTLLTRSPLPPAQRKPEGPIYFNGNQDPLIEKRIPAQVHPVPPAKPAPPEGGRGRLGMTPKSFSTASERANCQFFGHAFTLSYPREMQFRVGNRISKTEVAQRWRQLDQARAFEVTHQLLQQARTLALNDWAYCLLVHTASKRLYPNDPNAQVLFSLYTLSQSEYISRLCYSGQRLYLMLPTRQGLFDTTYMKREGRNYYVLDLSGKPIHLNRAFVLQIDYPEAHDVVDFRIHRPMKLPFQMHQRNVRFQYKGENFQASIRVNKNLVALYRQFPFTDWSVQLTAPLSEQARSSLLPQIYRMVKGRSQTDAVNLILRFVQKAFPYKTDRQQFGEENYLFAEEMLYYPYSDCEDRSALFAYLVKEIIRLDVIGLIFPGHAATAVRFTRPARGAYITHRGRRYTICDPTYINANYGSYLPQVRGKRAKIFASR